MRGRQASGSGPRIDEDITLKLLSTKEHEINAGIDSPGCNLLVDENMRPPLSQVIPLALSPVVKEETRKPEDTE